MTKDWTKEREEEEEETTVTIGSYKSAIRMVRDAAEEILLLWAFRQPSSCAQNSFVSQSSISLKVESCGQILTVHQSPSSLNTPGVTGAVMWDSGMVLAKFIEHAVTVGSLDLHGKKTIELGAGCGLVGCVASLLGAQVILTDLPDRLRLLKKNVESNLSNGDIRGSATVCELTWGDGLYPEMIDPSPDFVLASDVIYNEVAVTDLLITLLELCGEHTTILLSGELRNESAMKDFVVGQVEESLWHPDFRSKRLMRHDSFFWPHNATRLMEVVNS